MSYSGYEDAKRAPRLAVEARLARLNARRLIIQACYLVEKSKELQREARLSCLRVRILR